MTRRSAVALVESATQLLNVIEWAHRADAFDGVEVTVLAPKHVTTRRQLGRVGRLAIEAGIDVETIELRRPSGAALGDAARLMRNMTRADQVVLGDPFSGLAQTLVAFTRPDRIVVVDDGTATWEFRDCIDAQRPMLRWRTARTRSTRASLATTLLSPGRSRELTVFSCLSDATPVGAYRMVNDYAWTRGRSVPAVGIGEVDVIGASLAETGVVKRAEYVAAVAGVARRYGRLRYLAHRRESPEGLALIATVPGVRVVRADLPVELALREGPVAEHVIVFPSTAAHTLPVVLSDLPVLLEVRAAEPYWFTATSTQHVRRFVHRIADDAPLAVLDVA